MKGSLDDTNRFGLKRYITEDVRSKIRSDSGYGCVICGTLFCDYEHIEPEFKDAKKHDPDSMTLLCGGCHDKVTRKRWSKQKVWEAKRNPKAKSDGFVNELLEPSLHSSIRLGNSQIALTNKIITINGKPLLWFEAPERDGEPILVNAIFYDNNRKPIAFINRNQFTGIVGEHDILGEGTRVTIRPEKGKIALVLKSEGDQPIQIERIDMMYNETRVKVLKNQSLVVQQGKSNFSFGEITVLSCYSAFEFGDIPSTRRINGIVHKQLNLAIGTCLYGRPVITCNGYACGWLLGGLLINKKYAVVGSIKETEKHQISVYSIQDEFIGYLSFGQNNFSIEMPTREYSTYEPIWINPSDAMSRNLKISSGYDVSHRLFDVPFTFKGFTSSSPESDLALLPEKFKTDFRSQTQDSFTEVDTVFTGTTVKIDFLGLLDGKPFDGGRAIDLELTIGQGRMIDGFEDGLIGMKVGEITTLNLRFPDNYHAENLRGKETQFIVSVKSAYIRTN